MIDNLAFERVTTAIAAIRAGGMVIMTDDEDRENEGDLVVAAEDISPEIINFLATEARGLICLPLEGSVVDRLQLPMMHSPGKSHPKHACAFTVSIEARRGVTTGISATDRAETIKVAVADDSCPEDIAVPGHVFPLRAHEGGVLERAGHTEGSVDLARMAGKKPAAVICEIMNPDGSMARKAELEKFSCKHQIPIVSIEDLISYRLANDSLVKEIKSESIETDWGQSWQGSWFQSSIDNTVHFAITKGRKAFASQLVTVRVQRQNPLAELFSPTQVSTSPFSAGRLKLEHAFRMLEACEYGVLVLLANPSSAAFLEVLETKEEDPRLCGIGAQILKHLGVRRMNLHVSSSRLLAGLGGFGLEIEKRTLIAPTNLTPAAREVQVG